MVPMSLHERHFPVEVGNVRGCHEVKAKSGRIISLVPQQSVLPNALTACPMERGIADETSEGARKPLALCPVGGEISRELGQCGVVLTRPSWPVVIISPPPRLHFATRPPIFIKWHRLPQRQRNIAP